MKAGVEVELPVDHGLGFVEHLDHPIELGPGSYDASRRLVIGLAELVDSFARVFCGSIAGVPFKVTDGCPATFERAGVGGLVIEVHKIESELFSFSSRTGKLLLHHGFCFGCENFI